MDDDADGNERRARPSPRPRPAPSTESGASPRKPVADTAIDTAAEPTPGGSDDVAAANGNRKDAADTDADGDAGSRRRGWWRGRTASAEPPPTPRHAASVGRAPDTANPADDVGASGAATGNRGADGADPAGPVDPPARADASATAAVPSASRPRPVPRGEPSTPGSDAPAPTTEPIAAEASPRAATRSPRPPSLTKFMEASEPQDGDDAKERRFSRKSRTGNDAEDGDARPASAAAGAAATGEEAAPAAGPADAEPSNAQEDAGDAKSGSRRFGRKKREKKEAGDADEKKAQSDSGGGGRRLVRRFVRLAIVLAIIVAAGVALRVYVVQPYYIPSASMEPTLHGCPGCDDDHILINKLSYSPQEQDIVVFKRPAGFATTDNVLVKRIVGLPGDTVTLKSGMLYVNGLPITENYLNKKCGANPTKPLVAGKSTWRVPSTDVFVMGDNRCNSEDSRVFGPIPVSSIIGKVIAITWPFSRIGGVG